MGSGDTSQSHSLLRGGMKVGRAGPLEMERREPAPGRAPACDAASLQLSFAFLFQALKTPHVMEVLVLPSFPNSPDLLVLSNEVDKSIVGAWATW